MKNTAFVIILVLVSVCRYASAEEKALVISHLDHALQWAPCPDFIPKGCEIAMLRGEPGKDNLDVYFKVPADFTIPHHFHTSQERMVLVSGKLDVKYDNHDKVTVNVGEFAYGPAKLPHSAYCHRGDPCVLYIGFVAPLDAVPVQIAPNK